MAGNSLSLSLFIITFRILHFAHGTLVNNTIPSISQGGIVYSNTSVSGADIKWSTSVDGSISACSPAQSDIADSYFVMSYISTSPAKEITIDVKYALRCCTSVKAYKFSIGLYVLRTMSSISSADPSPMTEPYTYVGELRNTSLLIGNTKTFFNSKMLVDMKNLTGLYVAFRDIGICGNVLSLSWHYYNCPRYAGEHMKFPVTNAPTTSIGVTHVNGNCVANSQPKTIAGDNYMLCYTNGTAKVNGGCECKAGYENTSLSECKDCGKKTFKSVHGNFPCMKCGANVVDGKLPRISVCQCKPGFYRPKTKENDHNVNCEEPPTAPRNVNATYIASTWARLEWIQPAKRGTGDIPKYTVAFDGRLYTTGNLYFNLTGLDTFKDYTVTVSSINNVTAAIDMTSHTTFSFKTISGLPTVVQNLKLKRNDDGSVTVSWEKPASVGGSDLRYFVVVNGDKGQFMVKQNYTVSQSKETKKYMISIKSHTSAGFSDEKTISFEIQGKSEGIPITVGIGVGVGFFVLFVIAIILFVIFYKRRHPKHLQPVRLENGEVILPSRSSGVRVYIDPTTYQDVEEAVQEFANELDRCWVELEALIGGGEFGDVYKGILRKPSDKEKIVAVKTLKSNATRKARNDFLGEAAYMGQFEDPNVISIEGVVVKDRPVLIVIEFMSNGSLDSFLQKQDGKLSSLQLLGMARGVSSGMTYLSEMMFIHRDLAARNILVNENMVCKVADFGMSRELQSEEETYNTTGGKIPVRWTAPEAIQYKKFTVASDVWSYGVLLWEIMAFGERPYWDWGNFEVLERLATGYRLPPPMYCPKVVHDLMLLCWQKDRVKRPKFRDVRNTFDKWIRNPELLKLEASVVTKRDENLDYASMKTLKEWLDSIGLGHYIEKFTNKGLVTPRQILELNDGDLKEIGIAAAGHRNKIIKSIIATKGQLIRTKSMAV